MEEKRSTLDNNIFRFSSYHQTNLSLRRKESHISIFKFYSKFIGLSRHIVRSVLTWKMANISNSESAEEKPESGSEVSTEVGQTGEECKPTGSSGTLDEKANPGNNEDKGDKVEFKVIFNKKKYDVAFAEKATIGELKSHLQPLIGMFRKKMIIRVLFSNQIMCMLQI